MHAGAVGVPTANGRRRGYDPPVTTRSGAIAGATASAPSSSARPRPSPTRPSATWPRAWRPSALWVSLSWRHPGRTLSGAELTPTAVRSAAPEIVSQGSRGRGSMYVGCLHSGPGSRRWRHPPLFRVTPDPPCHGNPPREQRDAARGRQAVGMPYGSDQEEPVPVTDQSSGRAAKAFLVFIYHLIADTEFFLLPCIVGNVVDQAPETRRRLRLASPVRARLVLAFASGCAESLPDVEIAGRSGEAKRVARRVAGFGGRHAQRTRAGSKIGPPARQVEDRVPVEERRWL
jgi:hypothetical protein